MEGMAKGISGSRNGINKGGLVNHGNLGDSIMSITEHKQTKQNRRVTKPLEGMVGEETER